MTGSKIPKGYEVHHLDGDRFNNDIDNLLAIEKFTHRNYHKMLLKIYKGETLENADYLDKQNYENAKEQYDKDMKLKQELLNTK